MSLSSGISRRPIQAPVLSKYSLPKLKERDAGPEYQEGKGIPRQACRTLLCPQLITPRHSLVFCPQGSQSPTWGIGIQPASTLTHSRYLQEAESIGASLCTEYVFVIVIWASQSCPCGTLTTRSLPSMWITRKQRIYHRKLLGH